MNKTTPSTENTNSRLETGPDTGPKKTPLMQQYWDIKSAHEDKVVLFRMGDFFEMFHRDAVIAAPVLGIALTSRNKKAVDEIPMCGVPHHSVAGSINKLLQNGFKVAICDQIEDPKFAKGIVKRAVTRILSPGVVYDPETLDSTRPNYLASFDQRTLSFLDTTTGEAFYFLLKDQNRKERLICSLRAVEIIIEDESDPACAELAKRLRSQLDYQPLMTVHPTTTENLANSAATETASPEAALPDSARRLLSYARHMQGASVLATLSAFELRETLDRLDLPATVTRHLEIFETYRGDSEGSLFQCIHRCKTSAGARLLRNWLQFPLAEKRSIEARLAQVQFWFDQPELLKSLRSALGSMGDIERRLGKIGNPSCHPRDLTALAESLKAGLEVSHLASEFLLATCRSRKSESQDQATDEAHQCARDVVQLIEQTLADEPPIQLKNGGFIRAGVDSQLDELTELSQNSSQLILALEAREKVATGISSLKIRFNNVFGYYIEITNSHKDKVPPGRYERKQTLANAERYMTAELAELESKVLSAQAKRLDLEKQLFEELIARSLKSARTLLQLARLWSEVDVTSSLAWLALEQNYSRPIFNEAGHLRVLSSRHPVIEQSLRLPFVANDIELERNGCLCLTGPNMAGKSTLMRQVAIVAILAQMGSFVPAAAADLPIFDRIFTRIGASDFLAEGLSTFMVEMKETAEMLNLATENSLVILDEVGRGTSTFDGMSLAQAILEYLLDHRRSMTLFATHYHEITRLEENHPQLKNAHMAIHERRVLAARAGSAQEAQKLSGEITFLHQLVKGPAHKSYGIHVARLAGLPGAVTKRAAQLLRRLEEKDGARNSSPQLLLRLDETQEMNEMSEFHETIQAPVELPLPESVSELTMKEIKRLDLTRVTPLEALNLIAKWQQYGSEVLPESETIPRG
jgi:DNA mismatch repair protein MutS